MFQFWAPTPRGNIVISGLTELTEKIPLATIPKVVEFGKLQQGGAACHDNNIEMRAATAARLIRIASELVKIPVEGFDDVGRRIGFGFQAACGRCRSQQRSDFAG